MTHSRLHTSIAVLIFLFVLLTAQFERETSINFTMLDSNCVYLEYLEVKAFKVQALKEGIASMHSDTGVCLKGYLH